MVLAALWTLALLVLIAGWLCGTLSMASAMRASMPNVEPMPKWAFKAIRIVASLFLCLAAVGLASRAGFSGVFLAGFAAIGIAMGMLADLIWRRVRRNAQERARERRQQA